MSAKIVPCLFDWFTNDKNYSVWFASGYCLLNWQWNLFKVEAYNTVEIPIKLKFGNRESCVGYGIQNSGPSNDHMIKELSWAVIMVTDNASPAILRWSLASQWSPFICRLFAMSDQTKSISELCDINAWWKRHRSYSAARFGCNFACHVTYLPISPQRKPATIRTFLPR